MIGFDIMNMNLKYWLENETWTALNAFLERLGKIIRLLGFETDLW